MTAVPPNDTDAEGQVLSRLLEGDADGLDALSRVRSVGLQARHFYSDDNKLIFDVVASMLDAGAAFRSDDVARELKRRGVYERVGGSQYLMRLVQATPWSAYPEADAARVIVAYRKRRFIEFGRRLEAEGANGVEDIDAWAASKLTELTDLAKPTENQAPDLFGDRWVQLSERTDLLTEPPPPQTWLLDRYVDRRSVGVLPRGKTGAITGAGGTGKTQFVSQIAVAVATGGFLFETFRVVTPGHVLLALGEEDLDEARRRLWRAANAAELSSSQRRAMAERIDLLPLAGFPVALTRAAAPGAIVETEMAAALRKRLRDRGVEWALVVLDPLSRWAGGGIESDNESATRFVQVVESLTSAPGNPTVLVNHHSSKASAANGSSDARGVTGIRDGFRWMASLDQVEDDSTGVRGVRLRNTKSNYSLAFDELLLVRNTEHGVEGTLRLAGKDETASLRPGTREVSEAEIRERVLATVRGRTGLTSARQIADLTRGRKADILNAVKDLRASGALVLADGSFVVGTEQGGTG